MAIKIGHASIDENSKIKGGSAGDQTKKEVCTRSWYDKDWDFVLRPKSSTVAEKSAKACEKGCANNKIGYDQNQRNTLNTQAKKVGYDLSKITTKCETDCSAFMTVCAISGGADVEYGSNGPTTSTMKSKFSASGDYNVLTDSKYLTSDKYLKRGDILVKAGSHTVMVLENGSSVNSKTKLTVDGEWGVDTTKMTQKVLGTVVDGEVSNQKSSCKKFLLNALETSWEFKDSNFGKGSSMVMAIQKRVGATIDGFCGKGTVKDMQEFLKNKGYYTGKIDGYMGSGTVKGWQKYINSLI